MGGRVYKVMVLSDGLNEWVIGWMEKSMGELVVV